MIGLAKVLATSSGTKRQRSRSTGRRSAQATLISALRPCSNWRTLLGAGNADWSGHASFALGQLLKSQGDIADAKTAWQRVIDSGNATWAGPAFTNLVNLLREHHDFDGLRTWYQKAAELGNPDALYALDVLGQELDRHGDTEGAHAAWQQAIDAGYDDADDLRERISPPPEPEDEPADDAALTDLPPQFDPRKMAVTGVEVLDHGLPALPDELTYRMAIPVAYWKADRCAVVLFLRFSRHRRDIDPVATMATFSREGERWNPHRHWHGTGWSHDPIASPDDLRDLGGRALVTGGGSGSTETPPPGWPAAVIHGRISPAVKQLALIQNGHEDRRLLESHFGAWVVCTELPGPISRRRPRREGHRAGRNRGMTPASMRERSEDQLCCSRPIRMTTRRAVGRLTSSNPASSKTWRAPTWTSPQVISLPGWVIIG